MRIYGIFLVFACLFLSAPVSAQFVLKSGSFSQTFSPNVPGSSQATWTVSDNVAFSTTNSGTPTCTPDTIPVDAIFIRGGTRGPFVWTYQAGPVARGDMFVNTGGFLGHRFASNNPAVPQTRLSFSIPSHALPKIAPDQTHVILTMPFTMEGVFAIHDAYDSSEPPHYWTAVTGSGTATIIYVRKTWNVKAWRRNPNAELCLSSMRFEFAPPPAP